MQAKPTYTLVFVSTDGGAFGALGAAHFAESSPYRENALAVISLDALAGSQPSRLVIAGDTARSPSASLVRTAAVRVLEQTGRRTDPGLGAPPAAQSRVPVHAPRARPVRGARHSGLDPDDAARGRGRGIRDDRLRRHVRRADARGARPRVAEPDRIARRRSRAHPGNDELHLLRHAHRPRLGDRARPDDGAAAVPDRHDRPVRALPAPPDPARAGRPQPPPPALLLGLRRSAHLRGIAARRLPAGRAAAVAARPEPLRALARGARHPRRAAAHRLARRP